MSDTPEPKRPKLDKEVDLDELTLAVWENYRNYLDSMEHGEGEIDELQELIGLAKDCVSKPSLQSSEEVICPCWKSRTEMIPILISVAYYHLADGAISEYLMMNQQASASSTEEIAKAMESAQNLLVQSLEWYPFNASTWSMGANFGRMSQSLSISSSRKWYEMAVKASKVLRERALEAVDDESIPNEEKEWIELVVLNQIIGVEYEDNEEDNEEGGEDGETDSHQEHANKEEDDNMGDIDNDGDEEGDNQAENTGWYSASAVESTSQFMCAMLWSMDGRHDRALEHLKPFQLTHRLHPNVWQTSLAATSNTQLPAPTEPPLVFQPEGGVIPTSLYDSMKTVFAPNSAFWRESDYSTRGYYSFFHEFDSANEKQPSNLIEEVIVNHLLPRAQQCLDNTTKNSDDSSTICGFEWWAHTRPVQANLGHNLHFDTDESMLDQEGKVTHPILSSVLYLTGGNEDVSSGATIILDETPDSTTAGETFYLGIPKDNTFLIFPGNRLHGVLPCPAIRKQDKKANINEETALDVKDLMNGWKDKMTTNGDAPPHRLTFMVGFWTRNVPVTMKFRSLYGPCGPLPPATEEHTWVSEIMEGYNDKSIELPVADKVMTPTALLQASPAWEVIGETKEVDEETNEEPHLVIPHGIDHRFFVQGAPQCFRSSLFEDRETCQVE